MIFFAIICIILFFPAIVVVAFIGIAMWLCVEAINQDKPLYFLAAIIIIVVGSLMLPTNKGGNESCQ
jgi:type III secretory pathway component EscS